ncbi:AbrB/MazE/SpoVT family DNA-binding domain-containing protein [Virgibacillus doumboii]|uniref:AbrB/MazE/SpoVT family DNA-binding domain-containing protein n=1 Tax=Virgibacillus doumboii TaxID=2697503 RepID=UPI0013E06D91|nr:AbrB/MazE/SpoVT family DNA-binding domain-containing protein [Virgibacillus doumboii]
MERKIIKVGNNYGITFPKELLERAGISYGDSVGIEIKDDRIVLYKKELPDDISDDFYEVLERNITKHEETIQELMDR